MNSRHTNGKRARRTPRVCPRCQQSLARNDGQRICPRCLVIWHGDTFEPLSQDNLGVASLYEFFFRP